MKNNTSIQKVNTEVVPSGNSAEMLIAQAIEKNVNVETMERLLAMRRELKAEAAKEAFDRDMAELQAACPTIRKTKEVKTNGGQVAYRYAPIESVIEQVKEVIRQFGFRYATSMELITDNNGKQSVKVTCKVTHREGHTEETPMEVPLGTRTGIMSESQVVAAASTFAKRYAFLNAFGIMTGDEDNDGAKMQTAQSATKCAKCSRTDTQVVNVNGRDFHVCPAHLLDAQRKANAKPIDAEITNDDIETIYADSPA